MAATVPKAMHSTNSAIARALWSLESALGSKRPASCARFQNAKRPAPNIDTGKYPQIVHLLTSRLSISVLRVQIFPAEDTKPLFNDGFNQLFNSYATEIALSVLWKFNFLFMDEKSEFAKRLHDAMVAAGYEPRPVVLEREFNSRFWGRSVTFQAVRRWLKGEAIPSQEKLMVIAEWLSVEPQTLRFGDKVAGSVRARRQGWEKGVGYIERETFEAFLTLSAAQRKALREIIMALAGKTSVSKL